MNEREKKTVEIFVNTEPKPVEMGKISHSDLVKIAFGDEADPANYKVTYERGQGNSEPKDLPVNGDVQVHAGMIFNVSATAFS